MAGPFKMRSGNSPLFKMIGSSPAKDLDPHTGEGGHTHEGYTAGEEQLISDEGGVKTYRTDYTKPGGGSGGFRGGSGGFKNPAKPGQTWDEWLQTPEGKNWKEKNPGGEYHTIRREHMPLEQITPIPTQTIVPQVELTEKLHLPKPYRPRPKKKGIFEKPLISKHKKRKLRKWWKRTTTKNPRRTKLTCDASGNCAPTDDLVV